MCSPSAARPPLRVGAGFAAALLLPLFLLPLLSSCATRPAARERPAESPWASLSGDGELYLYAEVQQARSLLEALAGELGGPGGRAGPILGRSEQAYLSLHLPQPASGPPVAELALTGRWSADLLKAGLDSNSNWVRREAARPLAPYWGARRGPLEAPLEVGSPARGLLLAAFGRPGALEEMMARRLSPRPGPVEAARQANPRLDSFLAGSALWAFVPAPWAGRAAPDGGAADGAAEGAEGGAAEGAAEGVEGGGPAGLPVRELWLAARRQEAGWELGALAALGAGPAEGQGPSERALASLARLALASLLRKAGVPEVAARLRALQIQAEGGWLAARGLRLSEAELLAVLRAGGAIGVGNARSGD